MKSLLVRFAGFSATLVHGDTLVVDRWLWLRGRLPPPTTRSQLIDVGCGTGAFTIGTARMGYESLGLSWDTRNQHVAEQRAALCRASTAKFEVLDVRDLDRRGDLRDRFDVAICCEVIEHIMDDQKAVTDIANCLVDGGRMLLTTPYIDYKAITAEDNGPFSVVEDGWHVRRGYSADRLRTLCEEAGLEVDRISYVSGFLSQKITGLLRVLSRVNPALGWVVTLPLRALPPLLDPMIAKVTRWPSFCIAVEAHRPAR